MLTTVLPAALLAAATIGTAAAGAAGAVGAATTGGPAPAGPAARPDPASAASEDVCHRAPVRGSGFDRYGGWKGVQPPRHRAVRRRRGGRHVVVRHARRSRAVLERDHRDRRRRPVARGGVPYHEHVLARYGSDAAWAANTLARLCDLDVFSLAGWTNGGVARFAGKLAYPISATFLANAPVVPGWPAGLTGIAPRDVFDPGVPDGRDGVRGRRPVHPAVPGRPVVLRRVRRQRAALGRGSARGRDPPRRVREPARRIAREARDGVVPRRALPRRRRGVQRGLGPRRLVVRRPPAAHVAHHVPAR